VTLSKKTAKESIYKGHRLLTLTNTQRHWPKRTTNGIGKFGGKLKKSGKKMKKRKKKTIGHLADTF